MSALLLLKKFWYAIPIVVLAGLLALSNHHLSDARTQLSSERLARSGLASMLETTDDWTHIGVALRGLQTTNANRGAALEQISHEALTNKERADSADAALKAAQEENAKRYAAAQKQITALEGRKSTGNRDSDWSILEQDTQAAWKDWK